MGRQEGPRGAPTGQEGPRGAGDPPGSYLVGVGDVDGLSVLRHVADDALAPGHLHLVAVLGGAAGQQRGAGVHVEELGDQALLAGGRPLHEEEGPPVGVHHEADEDEDLVAEAGEVQVVGDVLDQLQEELPLVVLLEVALVVQGGRGVLGQADAGLQQGAEDVRGGGGQGAGLPQQGPPPHAAQRLLRPGVHMLVVGEVDVDGLGAGEALPQLLVGRPPLQPPAAGAARAAPAAAAAASLPLLRRAARGRLGHRVSPLQPLLHQLRVPVEETFHRRHVEAGVRRHGAGGGGGSGHAPTGARARGWEGKGRGDGGREGRRLPASAAPGSCPGARAPPRGRASSSPPSLLVVVSCVSAWALLLLPGSRPSASAPSVRGRLPGGRCLRRCSGSGGAKPSCQVLPALAAAAA